MAQLGLDFDLERDLFRAKLALPRTLKAAAIKENEESHWWSSTGKKEVTIRRRVLRLIEKGDWDRASFFANKDYDSGNENSYIFILTARGKRNTDEEIMCIRFNLFPEGPRITDLQPY